MGKVLLVFLFAAVLSVLQCSPIDEHSKSHPSISVLPAHLPKDFQQSPGSKHPLTRPAPLPATFDQKNRHTRDDKLTRPAPRPATFQHTPVPHTNLHQNPSHSLNHPEVGKDRHRRSDTKPPQTFQAQVRPATKDGQAPVLNAQLKRPTTKDIPKLTIPLQKSP